MKLWNQDKKNRKAAVAGKFYPGSKKKLESQLKQLFVETKAEPNTSLPLQALISPHAGYVFSGKVAASGFNQIAAKAAYRRIFVLASSHQYRFNGAAIYTLGNYETPLGEIEVDQKLGRQLEKTSDVFQNNPQAHNHEHSLEVQLPFLQYKLGNNFKLIPIILGTSDANDCKKLAEALKPFFTPENLFVISTDFSHYPSYEEAKKIDRTTVNSICTNNPKMLLQTLEHNKSHHLENLATSLCGWTSVLTLLFLSQKGAYNYVQLDYQNSGDNALYGDKKSVVGYSAIAIYDSTSFFVSEKEKEEILNLARNSIITFIKSGKKKKPITIENSGILNEPTGVFVSVYVKNKLRGCIGGFAQEKSLMVLLQEMAVASVCDHRYDKIDSDELDDLTIEVSVLSPLEKIQSVDQIKLGHHGVYIKDGYSSGTFLPQVAHSTGWSLEEFLGHCSRDKAGLGWTGWKTAELYTYEAIVIKEKQ